MKKYWWVFIIAAPLLSFSLAGIKVYYDISIWTYSGESQIFEVKSGEGFSSINARLKNKNIISSAKIFYRYAKINNYMTSFKAGKFEIKNGSNMLDVFDTLLKGQAITQDVTIPEGKNLFEIASILQENKIIKNKDEFIKLSKDKDFLQKLGLNHDRVEGYLYPDTYHFNSNTPVEIVIKTMITTFKNKTSELQFENNPMGLTSHQVLILASIVEKETGAGSERPRIAGVFYNRLKKRMRLQSDPTTIYGIYEEFNGNLRKRHLLQKTPYNTYKIPALPKGPISNPGMASLKAVINPEVHNYLYFVSQNDGTHVFTATYKEHLQAVNKYQKNPANREGKSWRDLNE